MGGSHFTVGLAPPMEQVIAAFPKLGQRSNKAQAEGRTLADK